MSIKRILEPNRQIDVIHETDVLVIGSGPGGLSAALASARCGVDTTLIERFGWFGGNITVVGVEGFAWYRHEKTIEAGGIGVEFEEGIGYRDHRSGWFLSGGVSPREGISCGRDSAPVEYGELLADRARPGSRAARTGGSSRSILSARCPAARETRRGV